MENNFYHNDDICVVGIGCVLSEADDVRQFWKNILAGHCSIREMPQARFNSNLYLDRTGQAEDKAYSNIAGFVEDRVLTGKKYDTRMSALAVLAAGQALDCISPLSLEKNRRNTAVFLGCMGIDETFALEKMYLHNKESLAEYIEKSKLGKKEEILEKIGRYLYQDRGDKEDKLVSSVLANSTVDVVRKKFGISGQGCMVDAACASSLAALDIAMEALKNYETDLVLSGGIEANLGPDTFVLFGKVGALSKGVCHPFDARADGLSQGEGAVVFALQRMEDALRDENKIYGVIRSIGSSSDGRSSSLFSPSSTGQVLALERAWQGLEKSSVDYIECHGTGTKVGDETEVRSLGNFFKGQHIPIGSVKALIGHTKGAAGAAGVLKCILNMENRTIPASSYVKNPIVPENDAVYINKENIMIPSDNKTPMRLGISSFGFGNINYHIVLEEFKTDRSVLGKEEIKNKNENLIIISRGEILWNEIGKKLTEQTFKILPKGIPQTDKAQLSALLAVAEAFSKACIDIESLDKENVSVISASLTCLDAAVDFMERIRHFELEKALDFLDEEDRNLIVEHKDKFPIVTEDTGPGILNNVISGKICNTFDFKGKNFNIDADMNSFPVALTIARRELKRRKNSLVVLVFFDEKLDKGIMRVEKGKASCILLSTLDYALEKDYPILEKLKSIKYHD